MICPRCRLPILNQGERDIYWMHEDCWVMQFPSRGKRVTNSDRSSPHGPSIRAFLKRRKFASVQPVVLKPVVPVS